VDTDAELRELLGLKTVAVVGCSSTPGKDAHEVPAYLRSRGYEVVPVNPTADEILGRPASDSLADVEADVDIANVFRPSAEVAEIVDEAITRGDVGVVWLQLGIHDDEAVARAEAAGLRAVQDRCMKAEHARLVGA
jgi:predicted CoA-binding protein